MQGPQDGDPRLRAAASQRFRLGNPNSIANNMGSGAGAGMMGNQRVAQMGNNNMMANMGGNQPGMGGNMQMMNQQQVRRSSTNISHRNNNISRCIRVTQA